VLAWATGTTAGSGRVSGSGAAPPTSVNALPVTATAAAPRRSGVGTDLSALAPARRRWRGTTASGSWCAPRLRGERCRATTCLPDRRSGKDVRRRGCRRVGSPCPFRDRAVIDPRRNVSNLEDRRTSTHCRNGREHSPERRVAFLLPRSGEPVPVVGRCRATRHAHRSWRPHTDRIRCLSAVAGARSTRAGSGYVSGPCSRSSRSWRRMSSRSHL
jgi:hypothetical protein